MLLHNSSRAGHKLPVQNKRMSKHGLQRAGSTKSKTRYCDLAAEIYNRKYGCRWQQHYYYNCYASQEWNLQFNVNLSLENFSVRSNVRSLVFGHTLRSTDERVFRQLSNVKLQLGSVVKKVKGFHLWNRLTNKSRRIWRVTEITSQGGLPDCVYRVLLLRDKGHAVKIFMLRSNILLRTGFVVSNDRKGKCGVSQLFLTFQKARFCHKCTTCFSVFFIDILR